MTITATTNSVTIQVDETTWIAIVKNRWNEVNMAYGGQIEPGGPIYWQHLVLSCRAASQARKAELRTAAMELYATAQAKGIVTWQSADSLIN